MGPPRRGGVHDRLGLEPVAMAGDIPTVRNPIRFSDATVRYDLAPPRLDADGDDVRRWLAEPSSDTSPHTSQDGPRA